MLKHQLLFVPFLTLLGLLAPGWLGVMLAEDDAGRPSVTEVVPDSPAAKAGIKAGDVIVALDDTATDSVEKLIATVGGREAGTKVKVKLVRAGKEQVITVELGKRPDDLGSPRTGPARLAVPIREKEGHDKAGQEKEGHDKEAGHKEGKKEGAKVETKTGQATDAKPSGRPFLGVALEEVDGGVEVTDVVDGSPAAKAGVDKGRLLAIGNTQIASLADVDKVMGSMRAGQTAKVTIRDKDTETFEVTLGGGPAAKVQARDGVEASRRAEAAAKDAEAAARRNAEKARAEAEKAAKVAEGAKAEAKKAAAAEQGGRAIAVAPVKSTDKVDVHAQLREAKGKQALLLVFGASWDASTKALKKSLSDEKVKAALGDRKVVWIDTDQNGAIADEFEVQQIPHMVLVEASGKRSGVIEGFQPAEMLAEKLGQQRGGAAVALGAVPPGPSGPDKEHKEAKEAKEPKEPKSKKPAAVAKPTEKPAEKPAAQRDLQEEIRALREEIKELRGLLQEMARERRR